MNLINHIQGLFGHWGIHLTNVHWQTLMTPPPIITPSPQTHLEATLQDSKDGHNNGANSEPG